MYSVSGAKAAKLVLPSTKAANNLFYCKELRLYFPSNLFFRSRMNGGMEQKIPGHNAALHKAPKNYKLLVDPFLVKGATKLYRYDGLVPGDSSFPPVQCRDPRSQLSRIWSRMEPADLPVPRYTSFYYPLDNTLHSQVGTNVMYILKQESVLL